MSTAFHEQGLVSSTAHDQSVDVGELSAILVETVRALVSGRDVQEMLQVLAERTRDLLGADEVGILLADGKGALQVVTATGSDIRLLELYELQHGDGPCTDASQTGQAIVVDDVTQGDDWPAWMPAARQLGFRSALALPLRLDGDAFGAVNVLARTTGRFGAAQLAAGSALADVATVVLISEQRMDGLRRLTDQLQNALDSRIVIEQAKGILAERSRTSPEEAFAVLRRHARSSGVRLHQVAQDVVDARLDLTVPREQPR